MSSKNYWRSVWATTVVKRVHLANSCNSFRQDCAWDLDSKVVMVLLSLLASTEHESAAVWCETVDNLNRRCGQNANLNSQPVLITYAADFFCDWVDAFIGSADHHLVDHDLFSAENDSVRADHATGSAIVKKAVLLASLFVIDLLFCASSLNQKFLPREPACDCDLPGWLNGLLCVFDLVNATLWVQGAAVVVKLTDETHMIRNHWHDMERILL